MPNNINDLLAISQKSVDRLLLQLVEYSSLNGKQLDDWQNRVSDEMSFANPYIWLSYKSKAYKNTNHVIDTWSDLVEHCSPIDDICHQRLDFISKQFSKSALPTPDNRIEDLLLDASFQKKVLDPAMIEEWQKYEFYIQNNQISKWQNY
jgi:hypothetical protein